MASTIDVTKPVSGNPTTQSVRDNFSAAKTEIEALQAADTALTAATALKADKASPTFTGTATIPTASIASITFNGVALTVTGSQLNGFNSRITALESSGTSDASTTVKGIVELATTAEAEAGTDATRAVTPAGLQAAIEAAAAGPVDLSAYATKLNPTLTGTITFNGTPLTPTAAEYNRLDGVTSNIQTQLNTKLESSNVLTEDPTPRTSAFTAAKYKRYFINSTTPFTATLPGSPSQGDIVGFVDYSGQWGTNNLTVASADNIMGSAGNLVLDVKNASIDLQYFDATKGWIIV